MTHGQMNYSRKYSVCGKQISIIYFIKICGKTIVMHKCGWNATVNPMVSNNSFCTGCGKF